MTFMDNNPLVEDDVEVIKVERNENGQFKPVDDEAPPFLGGNKFK